MPSAQRLFGFAVTVIVVTGLDVNSTWVLPAVLPTVAVKVAIPVVVPDVKVTVATPEASVVAELGEMLPSDVVKSTVSPDSGWPIRLFTCTVMVLVLVPLAVMDVGFAVTIGTPIFTVNSCIQPSFSAGNGSLSSPRSIT